MIGDTAFVSAVFSAPILVLLGMTSASAKERPHEVSGEVASVNVSDQTVVIKRSATNGAAQLKLLMDSGSKILVGNEKKSLIDVHVGDRVRGKYLNKDGKHIARTLYVSSATTQPSPTPQATQPVTPGK
jgi:hypothetical protein